MSIFSTTTAYFKFPFCQFNWRHNDQYSTKRFASIPLRLNLVILALLSNDDREIFKQIILAKDKDKFNSDEPDKFWDRAKNNGMYGWDVGKDIPTREELEEYKTIGMFHPKKQRCRSRYYFEATMFFVTKEPSA